MDDDFYQDCMTTLVLAACALLTWSFAAGVVRHRAQGRLMACKSNLKGIGTALEMYSTDWCGRYPTNINLVTPNYLKTLPTCPGARSDSYSASYQSTSRPDVYTLYCQGMNHCEAGFIEPNYPRYQAISGVLERP
ncbi:MAG: hypothetical protein AB7S38_17950 [Vulcanimicrobiota bacterium]